MDEIFDDEKLNEEKELTEKADDEAMEVKINLDALKQFKAQKEEELKKLASIDETAKEKAREEIAAAIDKSDSETLENKQEEQAEETNEEEVAEAEEIDEIQEEEQEETKVKAPKITKEKEETIMVSGNDGETSDDGYIYKTVEEIMHESMMPYTEHVILDRALPRVEDGLKPVQRRILYTMLELGITSDKPFKKCARIVGDCLGKYHPHGDSSVYGALVRMAQPFNMRDILIMGHGNFGSIDGDSAAAMRYTEAKLAPLAEELLKDLEKDTVKFNLNFDDSLKEPETLPGHFPNLLVNGASGIAVGLATNIPPHNLAEVIDATVAYIENRNITTKEIMKYIKGPDFPSGGYVVDGENLLAAYETGRGKITLRAKLHIESNGPEKKNIVITELPYQVNKANLLQSIASVVDENKGGMFSHVNEIVDESDRTGMRAIIRLKKDANVEKIIQALFKATNLQTGFGINMIAIADGRPQQMGILDILSYYTEYQRDVVLRRSKFDLENLKEREHILEGLIIAIKNIDEVIRIIKKAANTTEARIKLRERFALSEKQAQAILDMRLARLTNLEVYKLEKELEEVRAGIKGLNEIINSKRKQYEVVKTEMLAIKKAYKTERASVILKTDKQYTIPSDTDLPDVSEVILGVNASNSLKKIPLKNFGMTTKEFGTSSSLNEVHNYLKYAETDKNIYLLTNLGNAYKLNVEQISETKFKEKGTPLNKIIKEASEDEIVLYMLSEELTRNEDNEIIFITKLGNLKRTNCNEYGLLKAAYQAMKLNEGDEVINIQVVSKLNTPVMFITKQGMSLLAEPNDFPAQGRVSIGVRGINLGDGDEVIYGGVAENGIKELVVITSYGVAKRVVLSEFEQMARARKGLKIYSLDGKEEVIFARLIDKTFNQIVLTDNNLDSTAVNVEKIPKVGRTDKGKTVSKKKLKLAATYKIAY